MPVEAPNLLAAFRTTTSGGGSYTMTFKFPTMQAMHDADDEWRLLRPFLRDSDAGLAEDAGTAAEPRSGGSAGRKASPEINRAPPAEGE